VDRDGGMASAPRRDYIDGVLAATRLIWILAVLGIVVPAAALGWLVTTLRRGAALEAVP